MREIKFRAWNKKMGMGQVIEMESCDKGDNLFSFSIKGSFFRVFYPKSNNKRWKRDKEQSDWGSELELVQFTGLKDKNGKEVYEGDIIKIPRYKTKWCYLVVLSVDYYGLFLEYINPYRGSRTFFSHLARSNEVELIGNKFEDSELLK